MIRSISLILIALVTTIALPSYAQIPGISEGDISISMTPQNPGPNQTVQATIESYITNINLANITWRVNGRTEKQGIGEKTLIFKTGNTNTTTNLSVTVVTKEGQTINTSLSIRPADVDLIWESDGFTPPFFKGKTLFSHQNTLTVTAIPHIISGGQRVSSSNLLYTWKKNGTVIENSSGYGKSSVSINGSLISRGIEVSVEVTHPASGGRVTKTVFVSPVEPFIAFYKKDPLYGIEYQKALFGNMKLTDSREISIVSVPFLFGTMNPSYSFINYKWMINGTPIQNNETYNQVFRQIEGTSGRSTISLSINNESRILQYATNSFTLEFEE